VIIPAYNAAATLRRAATSVLQQTEGNLELLIVDDASADGTFQTIREIVAEDGRVSAISFQRNRGKSAAVNAAILRARGEWIAVLDADDWFDRQRLAQLLAMGERIGADLVADNQWFVDAGAERVVGTAFPASPRLRRLRRRQFIRRSNPYADFDLGMLKPMVRADFLRRTGLRYREDARLSEDFLFLVEFFAAGGTACLTDEPFYYWTQAFGTYSRRWTDTGGGPWRYDYRNAETATRDLLGNLSGSDQGDLRRLLRRRICAYQGLRVASDLARRKEGGASMLTLALVAAPRPLIWGTLLRRVARRARRILSARLPLADSAASVHPQNDGR
jgi:succinoglycan biosynthesis protein ExoO